MKMVVWSYWSVARPDLPHCDITVFYSDYKKGRISALSFLTSTVQ